jgi:glycosyltransferase involved in cell wall biosynthesis
MKLLVFAHTPPPHHGQSYGVQRMLEGFGGDCRRRKPKTPGHFGIECYHINARFSKGVKDIGRIQCGKFFLVIFYCLQAIWCRFRYDVKNFYYVPAPGKRAALYRDWLVMLICRPFFKKITFHWHAAGLAEWLETSVSVRTRRITHRLMKNADLSIVLSEFNRRDAEKFQSRRIVVVPAGVPNPCLQFEQTILPRRRARTATLGKILSGSLVSTDDKTKPVKVLYLAHCTREKGMFDTVEGVALANEKLARAKSPLRFRLTLVGAFVSDLEEKELQGLIQRRGLQNMVECLGFVPEERKTQVFTAADLFCFPTYYHAESFGAVLVEAMAFGLPIVTTRWRSIPEIFPPDYPGFVEPKSPEQIADALQRLAVLDLAGFLRERFVSRYTFERHIANLAEAIRSIEMP